MTDIILMNERPDDWLSRREDLAYRRGYHVGVNEGNIRDKALKDIMDLLGCNASTQYSNVPGMVKALMDKLATLDDGS